MEEEDVPKRFFFTRGWGDDLFYNGLPLVVYPHLISFGLIKDPIILLQTFNNEWRILINNSNDIYFVKKIPEKKEGIFVILDDVNDIVNVISKNLEYKTEILMLKQFKQYYFLGWYKVPKNGSWKSYKKVGIETIEFKKSSEHNAISRGAKSYLGETNQEKIETELDNFSSDIRAASTLAKIMLDLNDAEKDIEIPFPPVDTEKFLKLIRFYEINIIYNPDKHTIKFKF